VFDLIAGLGIEGVDLSIIMVNSHLPVEQVLENPSPWAQTLAAKLAQRGLRIADVHFHPGMDFQSFAVNNPDTRARRQAGQWFRRALEFAAGCMATHLTMYPGIPWDGEEPEVSRKRSADEISWRVEEAAKLGIQLAVEAHVGSIIPSPREARQFVESVPGFNLQ
jgi:sugar phosphate isomerase/epimerase